MGSVRHEGAAPGLAVFAGLRGRALAHVVIALFRRAALVDGGKRQAPGQAAGGRAGVHPGQFEGHQRQRQVLRTLDEAALRRVHENRGDAGFVECLKQRRFVGRPLVGVARARGHQAGHRAARHRPRRLHQHLQIVTVREAPQDLPDIVARKRAQVLCLVLGSGCGHVLPVHSAGGVRKLAHSGP